MNLYRIPLTLLLLLLTPLAFASPIKTGISGALALSPLPDAPIPAENPQTEAKIALGKRLFFDPILSGDNSFSCATCHNPELGWGDGLKRSVGVPGMPLKRHTPTLFNTAFQARWFWDGRAGSLEEQALGPIQAAGEMNQNLQELVGELSRDESYRSQFIQAFDDANISATLIARALAAFERTIITRNSPFLHYLAGDKQALSASARRGLNLFKGKARCILCHNGPNLTDNGFHNIGVKSGEEGDDSGHYGVLPIASQMGAFKTPGLHSTALTAPYMHNGSIPTLEAVITFYNQGGEVGENRDPQIKPLHLSRQEQRDLLAFLHSLTATDKVMAP